MELLQSLRGISKNKSENILGITEMGGNGTTVDEYRCELKERYKRVRNEQEA